MNKDLAKKLYMGAIAFTFITLPTQAAQPRRQPQPQNPSLTSPSPELDQLQYFQGTWNCSSTGVTVPFYPAEKPLDWSGKPSTWIVKRVLKNYWFLGQEEYKQVVTTQETLGFNMLTKRFGRTILTNEGEFINMLSNGWVKQTWIWEGSSIQGTGKATIREMIERTNGSEFVSTYFNFNDLKKQWDPTGNKVCKRSS